MNIHDSCFNVLSNACKLPIEITVLQKHFSESDWLTVRLTRGCECFLFPPLLTWSTSVQKKDPPSLPPCVCEIPLCSVVEPAEV